MFNYMVILAAGKSTRMKSSTSKVMQLIAERPALGIILDTVKKVDFSKVILVTSPDMKLVREFASKEFPDILHAIQNEALGTADAVKAALPYISEIGNVTIMYGDTPFVNALTIQNIQNTKFDFTIVSFKSIIANKYGRLITYNDDLLGIVEFNDATDEEKLITNCNSGIYSVKSEYLHELIPMITNHNAKKEFYLTDIIKLAVNHNLSCNIFNVDEEEVVGINTREDLSVAQHIMQKKIKSKLMNEGVNFINPESSYIAYDFEVGMDVTIYPNVFIGLGVKLGNNVNIRSFCHLENVEVKNNVNIGPFARLRPGTLLDNDVKIGNFVEIKNSKISKGSKISHLSYIGDSNIGSNTNIGAGAITCNYDGISKKSRTEIGNNVSVGSNCCLIAPVTISDRAYIAAGSVITKDVAEDDLAFGRARQINLEKKSKYLRENNE
jgi:bifunctional UDP-N-acetylglucosamine pyrophosphorylase / glucosamine-1-phosphate N-acetyltransferase